MLRNGSYSVWFRTRQGEGTGVIELNDGKVTGGDTVLAYTGSYIVDGDKFTASIATERHTLGQPSVFGIDDVDLTLTGKSIPTTASCTEKAKQAPDLVFEATLVRMEEQLSALPLAPKPARSPAFRILKPPQIARGAPAQKSKAPDCSEARPYRRAGYIRPRRHEFLCRYDVRRRQTTSVAPQITSAHRQRVRGGQHGGPRCAAYRALQG